MSEVQARLPEQQANKVSNKLEVNFNWTKIELKWDNKLTKNELKVIESLVTWDREKILEQTKNDLKTLKQVIEKDLQNRLNRKENWYIKNLLKRTTELLDKKVAENETTTQPENNTDGTKTEENKEQTTLGNEENNPTENTTNNPVETEASSSDTETEVSQEETTVSEENKAFNQEA